MDPDNPAPAAPETPAGPPAPVDTGTAPVVTPPEGEKPAPVADEAAAADPEKPAEGSDPETLADPKDDDTAADPEKPADSAAETENQAAPDLKSMSRAERAQYFQNLETSTRKDVEARVNEVYQPQPMDELKQKYIDQGHTEFEASMLAREEVRDQEADISRALAERATLNSKLAIEATEVLSTIDWLNPSKKDAFDKVSSDAATQLYDELCLTRDDNTAELDDKGNAIPGTGQIVGATMTPKQFYGMVDKIRSSGNEAAKLSAQKAAEEQMAAVAAPSSNNKTVDKAFDQLSNDEKRAKLRAEGHYVT